MTSPGRTVLTNDWVLPLLIVSFVYIASFAATFWFWMPAQRLALQDFENHVSLLFLPHGIRVLTALLYGWRALVFLTPGAMLTHVYLFGAAGLTGEFLIAALFGIFCATFSFWLFAKLGMDFRHERAKLASWREILLAGSFASVINSVGTAYFFGADLRSTSLYFLGDIAGLVVSMLVLMAIFRGMRKISG